MGEEVEGCVTGSYVFDFYVKRVLYKVIFSVVVRVKKYFLLTLKKFLAKKGRFVWIFKTIWKSSGLTRILINLSPKWSLGSRFETTSQILYYILILWKYSKCVNRYMLTRSNDCLNRTSKKRKKQFVLLVYYL